jgi:glycogen debranching enzyme
VLNIIIKHSWKDYNAQGEGKPKFILTSNGAYFYNNPNSKFQGLYYPIKNDEHNWTLFKVIDHIQIDSEIKTITNFFTHIELKTDKGSIGIKFENDVLHLDLDYDGELTFTLDMRESYEHEDKGRVYEFEREKNNIILEYTKYFNNMLENISYTKFLSIRTRFDHEKVMEWRLQHYSEDEKRQSNPYELYVFDAFKLKCKGKDTIKISFSDEKKNAINNLNKEIKPQYDFIEREKDSIEYNCAVKSLLDLYVDFANNKGFYAGLPWFFQIWTRDESISMKSIIDLKKYDLAKQILLRRIHLISESGRIPNRFPYSKLGTADGTGWTFKRIHELILKIKENEPFEEYFSFKDLNYIDRQLKKSIQLSRKDTNDFLIKNQPLETWMDTSYGDDVRDGYRIEIQALWLSMLKLSNYLDELLKHKPTYKTLEKNTREKVKSEFFTGEILKDGSNDNTIRPNVFLAHYIYPELLFNEEWEKVFDNSLSKLWLEWGGLSTIDKSSNLFCDRYSGENNKSYHRGDSWFFVNNIAAISLKRINFEKYKEKIEKIISASGKDMLYHGVIARPSELSSAIELTADASLHQLWSAATFIELANE